MDKLQVTKFDGQKDFLVWKVQVQAYLKANNKFRAVDGSLVEGAEAFPSVNGSVLVSENGINERENRERLANRSFERQGKRRKALREKPLSQRHFFFICSSGLGMHLRIPILKNCSSPETTVMRVRYVTVYGFETISITRGRTTGQY